MPQLRSGRHVALKFPSNLLDQMMTKREGEDTFIRVLSFDVAVKTPQDLASFMTVLYFDESQGEPPNAPHVPSGLMVDDVLNGRSDWTDDEVQELKEWITTNERLQAHFQKEWEEIDARLNDYLGPIGASWLEED